ncbi:MAG: flagellar M-ring protein FliF [Acidobacteriia bacterium]|nr:flagellar M-ring protein FliF [Terriglobia bacterium]
MNKILASLTVRQKITIGVAALLVGVGIFSLVHWRREADFRPIFTGLAPEDAAGVVQKLKEAGVDYRLPEGGGTILVPSQRLPELRLTLAAAGLPKTGRIGFELFDKTNLGATEFSEHVNFRRALEGELERSVMSLVEVEQARVHITFAKDSVYLDAQQPAKASVLVRLKPGAKLAPQNVQAINHLLASAVEGLSPDAVSVLDMNGNLLGKPHAASPVDGAEPSEAALEYRHHIESDLLSKINSTLEPVLGADKFRAGVSVDCDFSGGEQSEEIFDPNRSVMLSSQRSEDSTNGASAAGVPGTASALPRPTSRPGSGSTRTSRVMENVTYQSSRTVKKTHLPAGGIRKISASVVVDQAVTWHWEKNGYQRVFNPPSPEKLKVIHDLVAGVTGLNADRGDQLIVETEPFETTLLLEPPPPPATPGVPAKAPSKPFQLDRNTLLIGGGGLAVLIVAGFVIAGFLRRRKKSAEDVDLTGPAEISAPTAAETDLSKQLESQRAEHDALQRQEEAKALIKLIPAITKTAEVMARQLREKVCEQPEVSAQVLRSWIRDED